MKKRFSIGNKIAIYSGIAATGLAAATSAIIISNNKKVDNVTNDLEASTYKYVTFAADTETTARWTLTGNTRVAVKSGKIFNTVARPQVTCPGYTFKGWTETKVGDFPWTSSTALAEDAKIEANKTLYPFFEAEEITSIKVVGKQSINTSDTKVEYKALVAPTYAPATNVAWKVFDQAISEFSQIAETTVSTKATIANKTGSTGVAELTPTKTGVGIIYVVPYTTDGTTKQFACYPVEILADAATSLTLEVTSGESGTTKVGEEAKIQVKTVSPSTANKYVTWTVEGGVPSGETGSAGSAQIIEIKKWVQPVGETTEVLPAITIRGVTTGWVKVTATTDAVRGSQTSQTQYFQFAAPTISKVEINGSNKMDINDSNQFTAYVSPIGVTQSVTWAVYDEDPTKATPSKESTIMQIDTDGKLTKQSSTVLENGFARVWVQATSTETTTVKSEGFEVLVIDFLAFTYSYTDTTTNKRWYYDYTTIETNDSTVGIKRYCYDDPSQTAVTTARASFNEPITVGRFVSSIGDDFLSGCSIFNSAITFEDNSTLKDIGDGFLFGCKAFNQELTLPSTLVFIDSNFMNGCEAFAQSLTISANVSTVGDYFMRNCYAFRALTVNTAEADINTVWPNSLSVLSMDKKYDTGVGITVTSTAKTAFKTRYPDKSVGSETEYKVYRTLL